MSNRQILQNHAKAKRVYRLRADGVSCKKVAGLVGCHKAQVRALQLLGERLIALDSERPKP